MGGDPARRGRGLSSEWVPDERMLPPLEKGDPEGGTGFHEDEEFHLWSISGSASYLRNSRKRRYWVGAWIPSGLACYGGPLATLLTSPISHLYLPGALPRHTGWTLEDFCWGAHTRVVGSQRNL